MRLMPSFFRKKDRTARRPQGGKLRRGLIKTGVATAAIGFVGAGGWYLTSSGWVAEKTADANTALLNVTATAGLQVQDVVLTGRQRANADEILAALDLQRGSPILAVDMTAARERIESIGWVASAEIARRLPDVRPHVCPAPAGARRGAWRDRGAKAAAVGHGRGSAAAPASTNRHVREGGACALTHCVLSSTHFR